MITVRKKWNYFLLIVSLSFICIATLSPFNFSIIENFSWEFIISKFRFGSNLKDYWQNILLFIPFGFSLSAIIYCPSRKPCIFVIISLIFSSILSNSIELAQLLLPSRVSNLTDIIYNSIGGTVGSILFAAKNSIAYYLTAIVTGNIKRLSYKEILIPVFTYLLIVSIAVLILICSVNLSNWNDDYYLAIGNEINGVRPWDGYIKSLYISDRSLNSSEIIKSLEKPNDFLNQTPNLIVGAVFDQDKQVHQDSSEQLPDLLWQTKNNYSSIERIVTDTEHSKSVVLNSQQWLKTKSPAVSLNNSLKDKGEFTIGLIVASNNLKQTGPARIISLSQNIHNQNLIVAQEKADLHFRLRTPITGRNPTNPEFLVPNVFNNKDYHQIIITFDKNKLSLYIDKIENKYSYTFSPYTSFLIFTPWYTEKWSINLSNFSLFKYKIFFHTIIIFPFLLLIAPLIYKIAVNKKE